MSQFIVIILGFVIGLAYPIGVEPLFFEPLLSLLLTGLLTAAYVLVGYRLVGYYYRRMVTGPPEKIIELTGRYYRRVQSYRISLLLIYALEIYIGHWPLVVTYYLGLDHLIFLTNFLILLPLLLSYVLSWFPFLKMDRFIRQSEWKLKEYLLFQFRGYFGLIVCPLFFFILFFDIIIYSPGLNRLIVLYPFLGWLAGLFFILILYCGAPFFMKVIWSTRSLPPGPLRTRLENLVRKTGIGIKNFLIWPTGRGRIANAMIIGLWPGWRYIIFTDTLLEHLTDEEIETVCGHEIGHARHHHLLQYFLFALGYTFLLVFIESIAGQFLNGLPVMLPFFIFYWVIVFGVISRRFERQADLFGATVTENFDGFIAALEKITRLSGYSRSLRSLQHPSVQNRVTFLRQAQTDPGLTRQFLRSLKKIVLIFNLVLILGFVGVVKTVRGQLATVPEREKQLRAWDLAIQAQAYVSNGSYEAAISHLEKAIVLEPAGARYYAMLGEALAKQSGFTTPEARAAYQKAQSLGPVDPLLRMYLAQELTRSDSNGE
ncbi:MAG: M48 family metalloprotease [Planctomycetes bacterium]|nr:M48 family metalloprotease [Planctomycetota bacterium]